MPPFPNNSEQYHENHQPVNEGDVTLATFKKISDRNNIKNIKSAFETAKESGTLSTNQLKELNEIFDKAKTVATEELTNDVFEKLGYDPNDPELQKNLIDSKYLNHKVAGNLLDAYDVPQYKLRLFMRTKASINSTSTEDNSSSDDARKEQSSSTSKSTGVKQPNPEDIVILAETGSTDIGIDNLTIAHLTNNDDNVPTTFNFTLTEPGSVTLLDRIAAAKEHCGYENTADVPYFLEIEFKGYKTDIDDEDAGGEPVTIKGPYFYQLGSVVFSMDITPQGAVYEFTAFENSDIAKLNEHYRTKESIEISGKTIRELVTDLESKWNTNLKTQATKYGKKADTIKINLDMLVEPDQSQTESQDEANTTVSSTDLISNDLFKDKFKQEDFAKRGFATVSATDATVAEDSGNTSTTTTTAKDNSGNEIAVIISETDQPDPSSIKSKTIVNLSNVVINIAQGTSFDDMISLILSLSEDLFERATRLSDVNDLNSDVNKNKTYIDWFNVSTDIVRNFNEYDDKRNEYPKTIIFMPKLIKESRTDIGISLQELNVELTAEEVAKRINELKLYKEYYYMFSGKNDQIIDFNMRFNEAFALVHPAFGQGDFSQQSQMAIAPALQEKEAKNNKISNSGPSAKVEDQTKSQNILDTLKELKKQGEEAFNNLTSQFGDFLGFTDQEIKDITSNLDGEKAQLLAESLADERISSALVNNELVKKVSSPQTGSPTESDESSDTDSNVESGYINFLYASELIKGLEGDGLSESDAKTIVKAKVRNPKPKVQKNDTKNKVAEAPTERDSYRPSAFSHLMERHSEAASNQIINLTLRGDPWYLGANNFYDATVDKDTTEKSNQDSKKLTETSLSSAQWSGGSVDFLIVLESPRKFDFNVDDEDQNTGLFDFGGINYTMSGVYHTIKAVTNFSNGLFTVDIQATKNNLYDMSLIELAKSSISAGIDRLESGDPTETDISTKQTLTDNRSPTDPEPEEDNRTALQKGLVYDPITGRRYG